MLFSGKDSQRPVIQAIWDRGRLSLTGGWGSEIVGEVGDFLEWVEHIGVRLLPRLRILVDGQGAELREILSHSALRLGWMLELWGCLAY